MAGDGNGDARQLDPWRLEALSVVFGVLGRLFWEEPEGGVVDAVAAMRDHLTEDPFSTVAPSGAALLRRALDAYAADPGDAGSQFRQDRAYLFYQTSYSRTSPYESVYRTEDRTIFGPTAAAVKHELSRHDLMLDTGRNEPCDHFGIECLFASRVAGEGVDDPSLAVGATAELRRFLSEHLLVFGPIYLANVEAQARSDLYRASAVLAREALSWAASVLGAAPVELLDPADYPVGRSR